MEKSELKEILKKHGLDLAESATTAAIKSIFSALPEIVGATSNKYDDLLIPLLAVVEKPLVALVDQIDGEVG